MSAINLNIRDFETANLSECEFLDEAVYGLSLWQAWNIFSPMYTQKRLYKDFDFLGNFLWLTIIATYATLLIEFLFPMLVWFKPTKKYMLIGGVMLNLGILILSNIKFFFSLIMIVAH